MKIALKLYNLIKYLYSECMLYVQLMSGEMLETEKFLIKLQLKT